MKLCWLRLAWLPHFFLKPFPESVSGISDPLLSLSQQRRSTKRDSEHWLSVMENRPLSLAILETPFNVWWMTHHSLYTTSPIPVSSYQSIKIYANYCPSLILLLCLIPCLLFHLVKCNIKCYSCKTVSFIIWTSCCSIWYFDYSLLLCIDMLQWTYGFHSFFDICVLFRIRWYMHTYSFFHLLDILVSMLFWTWWKYMVHLSQSQV